MEPWFIAAAQAIIDSAISDKDKELEELINNMKKLSARANDNVLEKMDAISKLLKLILLDETDLARTKKILKCNRTYEKKDIITLF